MFEESSWCLLLLLLFQYLVTLIKEAVPSPLAAVKTLQCLLTVAY